MCGIVGFLNVKAYNPFLIDRFQKAIDFLWYRGPDYQDQYYYQKINLQLALGHTRLSIIDLSPDANQPMVSISGNSVITYNGEIYNYLQIRAELISSGGAFRTHSDTEVILNACEKWGIEKTLNKLDGMFAFAIWDHKLSKLVIARDRYGKKPLYYNLSSDLKSFVFSSDIRSVKTLVQEQLMIDYYALGYYLAELSTPEANSIWSNIKKLKPGHYAEIDTHNGSLYFSTKNYWRLEHTGNCTLKRPELIEEVDRLLTNSIKKRLVADVRVAALLSGGIDSSLVVAKMAEQSSETINTYTVGYKGHVLDESGFAQEVANKFNTNHTILFLDDFNPSGFDSLVCEFGEPFADSSMIPSYMICKQVSNYEKVVLGGDGGDEFFGGYDSYYKVYKLEKIKWLKGLQSIAKLTAKLYPSYRTRLISELLEKANQSSYELLNRGMGFSPQEIKEMVPFKEASQAINIEHSNIFLESSNPAKSELLRIMNASLRTRLVNDYLVKVDRASMYASIEMRSPFLDKELTDFTAQLTPKQLFYKGEPKSILKDLLKKQFPNEFVYRRKSGFAFTVRDFLKNEPRLESIILDSPIFKHWNLPILQQIIREHKTDIKDHSHRLYALYVLAIWANYENISA